MRGTRAARRAVVHVSRAEDQYRIHPACHKSRCAIGAPAELAAVQPRAIPLQQLGVDAGDLHVAEGRQDVEPVRATMRTGTRTRSTLRLWRLTSQCFELLPLAPGPLKRASTIGCTTAYDMGGGVTTTGSILYSLA